MHGFGLKRKISSFFLFGEHGTRKSVWWRSRKTKLDFLHHNNIEGKKTDFYFGQKMWNFFIFFFLGNIGREEVFSDVLDRKRPFLDNKKVEDRKSVV